MTILMYLELRTAPHRCALTCLIRPRSLRCTYYGPSWSYLSPNVDLCSYVHRQPLDGRHETRKTNRVGAFPTVHLLAYAGKPIDKLRRLRQLVVQTVLFEPLSMSETLEW